MSRVGARKRQRVGEKGDNQDGEAPVASPKASPTKLGKTDQKRINESLNVIQRNAVLWIWNHLNDPANSDEILMCKEQLMNGFCRVSSSADTDHSNCFHSTYVSFQSLPKYWIAAWMVQHAEFAKSAVDSINGTGSNSKLKQLWCHITGIDDHTHWPAEAHDKIILVKFVFTLMGYLGDRHKKIVFLPDFSIDWNTCGPFRLIWGKRGDMTCVLEIEHKQTKTKACDKF